MRANKDLTSRPPFLFLGKNPGNEVDALVAWGQASKATQASKTSPPLYLSSSNRNEHGIPLFMNFLIMNRFSVNFMYDVSNIHQYNLSPTMST